jgi:hypothetical protein
MSTRSFKKFTIVAATSLALLFASIATRAQSSSSDELKVTPSSGDHTAALAAKPVYKHAVPATTPAARQLRAREIAARQALSKDSGGGHDDAASSATRAT